MTVVPQMTVDATTNENGNATRPSAAVQGKVPSDSNSALPEHEESDNSSGPSSRRKKLISNVVNVSSPLILRPTNDEFGKTAAALPYNAICIEMRDMFRIMDGFSCKVAKKELTPENLHSFYSWFEGFYGIVTCIFEVQEDVLFPWLEKSGAIEIENALAPKRRKTKQERTKDACWDILELKIQFQKKDSRKICIEDLVQEMCDEAQHLASRLLTYIATVYEELPPLICTNFSKDEWAMIEKAMVNNLRSSEQGKFVLAAYARGILDPNEREEYLSKTFISPKLKQTPSIRPPGMKAWKRFLSAHVDIPDQLAATPSMPFRQKP